MPSTFNARERENYEQVMGRWSRWLAPLFVDHTGAAAGERLHEVGYGTGSLTFTMAVQASNNEASSRVHSRSPVRLFPARSLLRTETEALGLLP